MTYSLPIGNTSRRQAFAKILGMALAPLTSAWADPQPARPLRIGLTPAFVIVGYGLVEEWRRYLEDKLRRRVEFIQRDRYRETIDLLRLAQLDFAWICDYPFVYLKDLVRLVAVPVNKGEPYYQSYVIVAADDSTRHGIRDMKGSIFAYADPYSSAGYLYPRYLVRQLSEDPATFFRKTFFTWSHAKSIEAVASGFAQGAAVDSCVWDTLARLRPDLTTKARIIARSPKFGSPPIIAHRDVGSGDVHALQAVLFGMRDDPAGKSLLDRLNTDGFVAGDEHMYDLVAKMMRSFGES